MQTNLDSELKQGHTLPLQCTESGELTTEQSA